MKLKEFDKEELILINFIQQNDCEWRKENDSMYLLWVDFYNISDFVKEFEYKFQVENRIMANIQESGICLDLFEIFDREMDLEKIYGYLDENH